MRQLGRRLCSIVIAGLAIGCEAPVVSVIPCEGAPLPPCASGSCVFDPFELLADPYLPARMLPGRMRLASSREPEPPEGSGNDDYNNYLHIDAGQHVLLEADGPGVVTRVWFTGREPATQDYTVLDRTVLHAEIDGSEVVFAAGEPGVPLALLTSGTLPAFPRPWVAGRESASNGFIISVPIAFSHSLRLWIDAPPGLDTFLYYQVDWRELPIGTEVEPFAGTLSSAQRAALEAATGLWVDRSVSAAESTIEDRTIAPDETAVLTLSGPTTVRAVAVTLADGSLSALEGELVVDEEIVVTGPLARWTFASPPTEQRESALSSVAGDGVVFRYPFPVHASAELRLRNTGSAPISVRTGFEHDPGAPDPDLGSLRTSCGVSLTPGVTQNLTLLDLADRRGHYAGQFLVVRSGVPGFWSGLWVLEGDHEIVADDTCLLGTGLEDYFGGAFYYLRGSFSLPLSGASGRSELDATIAEVSQYRHHLLDTIPFERRFRFDYESFVEDSTFEHCIFWYEAR